MTVVDVLRARREEGSRPGARSDEHRVALAIEGGGNRAAYSAGMCLAIDELGLTDSFDAVYGTSGGALNAAWLLTGEAQRWLPSWASPMQAGRLDFRSRTLRSPSPWLRAIACSTAAASSAADFWSILARSRVLNASAAIPASRRPRITSTVRSEKSLPAYSSTTERNARYISA